MGEDELELLRKFKDIIEVYREVKNNVDLLLLVQNLIFTDPDPRSEEKT